MLTNQINYNLSAGRLPGRAQTGSSNNVIDITDLHLMPKPILEKISFASDRLRLVSLNTYLVASTTAKEVLNYIRTFSNIGKINGDRAYLYEIKQPSFFYENCLLKIKSGTTHLNVPCQPIICFEQQNQNASKANIRLFLRFEKTTTVMLSREPIFVVDLHKFIDHTLNTLVWIENECENKFSDQTDQFLNEVLAFTKNLFITQINQNNQIPGLQTNSSALVKLFSIACSFFNSEIDEYRLFFWDDLIPYFLKNHHVFKSSFFNTTTKFNSHLKPFWQVVNNNVNEDTFDSYKKLIQTFIISFYEDKTIISAIKNFTFNGNEFWWTKCVPFLLEQLDQSMFEFVHQNKLTLKDSEGFSIIEWFLFSCTHKSGPLFSLSKQDLLKVNQLLFNNNSTVLNRLTPDQAMSLLKSILSCTDDKPFIRKLIVNLFNKMTAEFISSEFSSLEHPINIILQASLSHIRPNDDNCLDRVIFNYFDSSDKLNFALLETLLDNFLAKLLEKNQPNAIALESQSISLNTIELILYHQRTYLDNEKAAVLKGKKSLYSESKSDKNKNYKEITASLARFQQTLFNSLSKLTYEQISKFLLNKETREEDLLIYTVGAGMDAFTLNNESILLQDHINAHLFFIKYTQAHMAYITQQLQTASAVRPAGYVNFLQLYYLRHIVSNCKDQSYNQIKSMDTYNQLIEKQTHLLKKMAEQRHSHVVTEIIKIFNNLTKTPNIHKKSHDLRNLKQLNICFFILKLDPRSSFYIDHLETLFIRQGYSLQELSTILKLIDYQSNTVKRDIMAIINCLESLKNGLSVIKKEVYLKATSTLNLGESAENTDVDENQAPVNNTSEPIIKQFSIDQSHPAANHALITHFINPNSRRESTNGVTRQQPLMTDQMPPITIDTPPEIIHHESAPIRETNLSKNVDTAILQSETESTQVENQETSLDIAQTLLALNSRNNVDQTPANTTTNNTAEQLAKTYPSNNSNSCIRRQTIKPQGDPSISILGKRKQIESDTSTTQVNQSPTLRQESMATASNSTFFSPPSIEVRGREFLINCLYRDSNCNKKIIDDFLIAFTMHSIDQFKADYTPQPAATQISYVEYNIIEIIELYDQCDTIFGNTTANNNEKHLFKLDWFKKKLNQDASFLVPFISKLPSTSEDNFLFLLNTFLKQYIESIPTGDNRLDQLTLLQKFFVN
ncbi:MAG: hypothetical protein ACON35_00225 [Candidatus Marinamargulisbacteria bacterium]